MLGPKYGRRLMRDLWRGVSTIFVLWAVLTLLGYTANGPENATGVKPKSGR